ncbi:1,4-dihydroxy-2-naphthoate octaprenyltransferase [Mucilaginibacter gracilis]|uniref:1,4-dihydroxy-2-naphthoate octaprenyltransferase n=1 Tax=Mucilaginibacter gracilis TaxID=423350 RepID=A0A495IXQ6_9SPHI|nr:UbiA family prenyltransferase [Mucilaginibacter gracilis]RKR80659.1 1,4-dihydroxy-2-naphthoate octaprenyltransferase [Mucilaginibacter gracilis]
MQILQFIVPSRSAIAHLRFVFSLFLMPVYFFAYSQALVINAGSALLVFLIWHVLAFPASNGYNSYFDKDEESIGLLDKPPVVDISLYYFSLLLETAGFLLGFLVSWQFAFAVLLYGIMSKLYSHPKTRLKKYPVISFLTVFFFQGAFIYFTTYTAITGTTLFAGWNTGFIMAGAICSCLIGASYPLTQVYQHGEDGRRGDFTISILLGYKGSFIFSGALFATAILLSFFYWQQHHMPDYFYFFLFCSAPVFVFFNYWFYKVGQSTSNANYKNAMLMNFISAGCMLFYFLAIAILSGHVLV